MTSVCLSTGLLVKNTFLDIEPDLFVDNSPRGAKSCIARFSKSTVQLSAEALQDSTDDGESTDGDESARCIDTEDEDSDEWAAHDNSEEVASSCLGQKLMVCKAQAASTPLALATHPSVMLDGPAPKIEQTVPLDCCVESLGIKSQMHLQETSQLGSISQILSESLPSLGSQYHGRLLADGQPACQPCAWHHRGCAKGADCMYCHLCPEGELKNRKKLKIARFRAEDQREKRESC
jgi:hypothetical protein